MRIWVFIFGAFALTSCATHESLASKTPIPISVLESRLTPRQLFEKADNFLEYQMGYSVKVRDLEAGLLVTDWTHDAALEREQITLHVAMHDTGSLLSAHIQAESLNAIGWAVIPSNGERESLFLSKMQTYLGQKKK